MDNTDKQPTVPENNTDKQPTVPEDNTDQQPTVPETNTDKQPTASVKAPVIIGPNMTKKKKKNKVSYNWPVTLTNHGNVKMFFKMKPNIDEHKVQIDFYNTTLINDLFWKTIEKFI